ncbi:NAC domain containing protein 82, putative [Theobroma cacao]|uniref:NAC domain containing protein 82, putative n=1 Tax=Theobroma cacao TaxID=3641 RepID=A0A061GHJ5_THECC|nr:NAC domain containing protein 82, putative [Theobroma cacao]
MEKNSLAPGFRFHPTDVELLQYYLRRKVLGKKFSFEAIAEVDIYKYAPWDLPHKSLLRIGDLKWYFFCPMKKKYGKGSRFNRATPYGFWKTTGKDRPVRYNDKVVGSIRTLVFHRGKAPRGDRTDWVLHEYRLEDEHLLDEGVVQDDYVLCVIFCKDGPGHRNGAQYGAPFREEDWTDDEEVIKEVFNSTDLPTPTFTTASPCFPQSQCLGSPAESSHFAASPSVVLDADKSLTSMEASQVLVDDSISAMLSAGQSEDYSPVAIANDDLEFLESPDIAVDDEIMSLLATFREDDTLNSLML